MIKYSSESIPKMKIRYFRIFNQIDLSKINASFEDPSEISLSDHGITRLISLHIIGKNFPGWKFFKWALGPRKKTQPEIKECNTDGFFENKNSLKHGLVFKTNDYVLTDPIKSNFGMSLIFTGTYPTSRKDLVEFILDFYIIQEPIIIRDKTLTLSVMDDLREYRPLFIFISGY